MLTSERLTVIRDIFRSLLREKMLRNTYGPRPNAFALDDCNERYYIGSEVGNYLKLHRGTLYKKYPQLWKRAASVEEKAKLQELAISPAFLHTNIMLVRASEVDDLLAGNEEKYKGGGVGTSSTNTRVEPTPLKPAVRAQPATPWGGQQVTSGSHHLESVPCSCPVAHARGRIRPLANAAPYTPDTIDAFRRVQQNADVAEDLVPIRLDMELDGIKLRDTFCFNRNERMITTDQVAENICEDLDLPSHSFLATISSAIQQQLEAAGETPQPDSALTDQRAVIKLNIHVGNQSLVDQFEWDMTEPANSPEAFAEHLCSDLGLGGEFAAAIAYSIRGQLAFNLRTYAYSESPLPVVDCAFRPAAEADQWSPFLETLTDAEMEKKMRDQDRNTRRMRRLMY